MLNYTIFLTIMKKNRKKAGTFSNREMLRPIIHLWIMRSVFLQAQPGLPILLFPRCFRNTSASQAAGSGPFVQSHNPGYPCRCFPAGFCFPGWALGSFLWNICINQWIVVGFDGFIMNSPFPARCANISLIEAIAGINLSMFFLHVFVTANSINLRQDDHLVVLPRWGVQEALIFLEFFRPKG